MCNCDWINILDVFFICRVLILNSICEKDQTVVVEVTGRESVKTKSEDLTLNIL